MKTKVQKKKRTHYYAVEISHDGTYSDITLEDAVGKDSDFSGSGFGQRDIGWYFDHLRQALKAFKTLAKYRSLSHLSIDYRRDV